MDISATGALPQRIVPVVLAGGSGTRLWPISRAARPKQFLPLMGQKSLFQQTLLRLRDDQRYAAPMIITNEDYRFLVAEQAHEVGVVPASIALEPVARNTAPAIAAASVLAMREKGDPLIHVLPSDHGIVIDDEYGAALDIAERAADAGRLATFGIAPSGPATEFGYIKAGAELPSGAREVVNFVEKPDAQKAAEMLAAGSYYWNSGMFVFRASVLLEECRNLAPDIHDAAHAAVADAGADLDFLRLGAAAFSAAPSISVDYAIFEMTALAAMVPANIHWSDLGSWSAVWKSGPRDENDNLGMGKVTLNESTHSLVISESHHVVLDGLEDVAVLASEDAVYVGRLSSAQSVGEVVKRLKADPATRHLTEIHRTSYRPWGGYTSVLNGARFQVKRLFVKRGCRLSLQKHLHRSEHWVVVRGTAEVQVGETVRILHENESIYIPRGEIHRLSNPGRIELEVVEVQTGDYLGEDDIIRIEDEFGRS